MALYQHPAPTFSVGPSQLHPSLPEWMVQVYETGLLGASHRGKAFCQMMEGLVASLHDKLAIPADYTIAFTASATENWEILSQSSAAQDSSYHVYSGSFGKKWFDYALAIRPQSVGRHSVINQDGDWIDLPLLQSLPIARHRWLCLTQNETSNGTHIPLAQLAAIRKAFPSQLIAYDLTSSMGGIAHPWEAADYWYGSVQKCFGLPAGVGIMVLSPAAVDYFQSVNERNHYNSMAYILEMISQYQTTYTPNVLGLALLEKAVATMPSIDQIEAQTLRRYEQWQQFLTEAFYRDMTQPLIKEEAYRSRTVLAIAMPETDVPRLIRAVSDAGMTLGSGYGQWKKSSVRIANFPVLTDGMIENLRSVLGQWVG